MSGKRTFFRMRFVIERKPSGEPIVAQELIAADNIVGVIATEPLQWEEPVQGGFGFETWAQPVCQLVCHAPVFTGVVTNTARVVEHFLVCGGRVSDGFEDAKCELIEIEANLPYRTGGGDE